MNPTGVHFGMNIPVGESILPSYTVIGIIPRPNFSFLVYHPVYERLNEAWLLSVGINSFRFLYFTEGKLSSPEWLKCVECKREILALFLWSRDPSQRKWQGGVETLGNLFFDGDRSLDKKRG